MADAIHRLALAIALAWMPGFAVPGFSDAGLAADGTARSEEKALAIGSRRELFVDDYLIAEFEGARLRLHSPTRAGVALRFDRLWEGRFCGYVTIIRDGARFRMYYRGLPSAGRDGSDLESTCYAESDDGIHWKKPSLSLFEVNGTKKNNVVLKGYSPASHNFCPFLDKNPAAGPAQRFKALGGGSGGLFAFVSADGVRWNRVKDDPVITKGAFDSQNVSFWSESEGCYVCYFRTWDGYRTVSRTTSKDFVDWSEPSPMSYGDTQREHLYTNQTHPYFRAPHIYVSVAARFMPGRRVLSIEEARAIDVDPGYFGDCSDAVLMTSRGGTLYERTFMEAFIRPGPGLENWVSRTNYPALGILPTGDGQLSIYVQKNYGQPTARLDRYTLRTDGFVSVSAGYAGGELITKAFVFAPAPDNEVATRRREWRRNAGDAPVLRTRDAAIFGASSLRFREPAVMSLPGTRKLGRRFTLAAHVRSVPSGHRRLFSAYDGGATKPREMIFDLNSGGAIDGGHSLRFFYDGERIGAPLAEVGVWSAESGDDKAHHLAVTWDDGRVRLYFDGRAVAEGGEDGHGPVELRLGDLLFGEDYPGTSRENEPFAGLVDDLLVVRRALSPAEVAAVAAAGAEAALGLDSAAGDLLFTMEEATTSVIRNRYRGAGLDARFPPGSAFPRQQLALNFATSAAGSVRVEIRDATGNPLPGFAAEDCVELIGDSIERAVSWKLGSDVSELAGKPIRLRFVMKDADVYSLRFR